MYSYFENKPRDIYTAYHTDVHSFKSHFHNKLEIAYCFSGVQQIKIGKTVYTMKKGDTAVVFPNTVHEYMICEQPDGENTECISLMCSAELINKQIPQITTMKPECPFIKSEFICENTKLAFRKMINAESELELLGWTYVAVSGIVGNMKLVSVKETQDLKLAPQIIAYIHENFQKPLTLKYLAKEFGYNPSYIAHLFCDQLKIPFRTYLGAVRSEYVASQIRMTDKSLTEIAYNAGYDSLNTFCRCFKKHFSKTPSEYKKEVK